MNDILTRIDLFSKYFLIFIGFFLKTSIVKLNATKHMIR